MNVFTLKDAKAMGEKDEKYGYTYWSNVEEIDIPVMFNSMKELTGFETISAEETNKKTSAKGNDYLRLSKVKVAESSGSQGSETSNSSFLQEETKATQKPESAATHLEEILKIVKENNLILKELRGDIEEKVQELTQEELGEMPPEFLDGR